MAATLEGLPAETFATIIAGLRLKDLLNLRLTSRTISHLATQGRFRSWFAEKRVFLTEAGLQRFCAITRTSPALAATLHTLTLTHPVDADALGQEDPSGRVRAIVVKKTKEEPAEWAQCMAARSSVPLQDPALLAPGGHFLELLSTAFRNLKAARAGYRLVRLRLKVAKPLPGEDGDAFHDQSSERNVWRFHGSPPAVARTFDLAFTALKLAKLPFVHLDIFTQYQLPAPWDVFTDLNIHGDGGDAGNSGLLASLRHLEITLSEPVSHGSVAPPPAPAAEEVYARNVAAADAFHRFLILPPAWHSLCIGFQRHDNRRDVQRVPTARIFHRLGTQANIQTLQSFMISGLAINAADLYCLLEGCRDTLAKFVMWDISLDSTAGISEGLIDFCTQRAAALQSFEFMRIGQASDRGRHVIFREDDVTYTLELDPDGNSDMRCGPMLKRSGADVRKPIRILSELQLQAWQMR